jgi:GR25 family glycosyltransferase involved in LPS biosynthesis
LDKDLVNIGPYFCLWAIYFRPWFKKKKCQTMPRSIEVHVIALASKWATRGRPTTDHFQKAGLVVHRFDAVTPADFDQKVDGFVHPQVGAIIDGGWQRDVPADLSHINQVACALSHYALWRRCIELDRPIIVAEDDSLPANMARRLQDLASAPPDADLVLLQCMATEFHSHSVPNNVCRKVDKFWGASCYYLTPTGAAKMIRFAIPVVMHVDAYMARCLGAGLVRAYSVRGATDQTHEGSTLMHSGFLSVTTVRRAFWLGVMGVAILTLLVGLVVASVYAVRGHMHVSDVLDIEEL